MKAIPCFLGSFLFSLAPLAASDAAIGEEVWYDHQGKVVKVISRAQKKGGGGTAPIPAAATRPSEVAPVGDPLRAYYTTRVPAFHAFRARYHYYRPFYSSAPYYYAAPCYPAYRYRPGYFQPAGWRGYYHRANGRSRWGVGYSRRGTSILIQR